MRGYHLWVAALGFVQPRTCVCNTCSLEEIPIRVSSFHEKMVFSSLLFSILTSLSAPIADPAPVFRAVGFSLADVELMDGSRLAAQRDDNTECTYALRSRKLRWGVVGG